MPERAPQVIVIAGPNGAGKTSAARDLLRDTVGITGREDRTGGSLRSAVDPVPSRYWSPRRGY
jgi:ABC-type Mn2+/Zn2+ transport system ATPase subunit